MDARNPSRASPRSTGERPTGLRLTPRDGWMFAGFVLFFTFVFYSSSRSHDHRGFYKTQATSNLRQLGLAMFEFKTEYGAFPNRDTIPMVKADNPENQLTLGGNTSNDFFAQLLASNIAGSEQMFHAMAVSARNPDNVFGRDDNTLLHGECAFAYIPRMSGYEDREVPLVFGPVIPGTSTLDREIYQGKAVILNVDNSCVSATINKDGNIVIGPGKVIDLKRSTFAGKPLDIKWPK